MKVSITYGDSPTTKFKFDSENGYPTPAANIGINQLRTSAGDYLSTEKTVTLQGVCYVDRMTTHDDEKSTQLLPANKRSNLVKDLFLKASGLQDKILTRNNQKLFIGVAGSDANPLIYDNASIESISFSPNSNNWSTTIDYEISFKIYVSGTGGYLLREVGAEATGAYVSSITDNYQLELLDSDQYIYQDRYAPTYKLSRTLGAVGKRIQATSGAIFHAKQWVAGRERAAPLTGMFRPDEFILYNQERSVDIDEPGGAYTITDSFIAKSGNPWIDKWTIETSVDEKFNKKFVLNGSVQGLEPATGIYGPDILNMELNNETPINPSGHADIYPVTTGYAEVGYTNDDTGRLNAGSSHQANPLNASSTNQNLPTTAYHNAVSGYQTHTTPQLLDRIMLYKDVGETLVKGSDEWHGKEEFSKVNTMPINPIPLSSNEALFPFEGKITYSREFDCRPMPIITGALVESIKVSTNFPTVRTKEIKILGRRLGPIVYEYYNSLNGGTRTVTYEGVFPRATGLKQYSFPQGLLNDMSGILMLYAPPGIGYLKEDKQNLNLTENKVTKTLSWAFNKGSN